MYINLHCHTHYSALDGIGSPKEYLERAAEIGMSHLAITDHGTLMGHRDFQREAKAAGVTPILGLEGYQTTDRFDKTSKAKRSEGDLVYNHLTLLAINENGLTNLNKISEIAWSEGFYSKPRFDFDALEEYGQDIVALSGCMSGMVAKALEANDEQKAGRLMERYISIFGDRFFVEVMSANAPELNAALIHTADKYGVKIVVTDDCHHVRKEDLWIQEATLILNTNPKHNTEADLSKSQKMDYLERFNYLYPDRKMSFEKFDLFLHSEKEKSAACKKAGIPQRAVDNTNVIASMIGDYPYHEPMDLLPKPDGNADEMLTKLAYEGLAKRGLADKQEYRDRLQHELDIIIGKGFSAYFLIVEDIVSYARSVKIKVGPGRGSAAGSLVVYSLFVTDLDPIKRKLIFFRFMDPERDDWPDIDIDFEVQRRHEVKEYARNKYGNVASIVTIGYFGGGNDALSGAGMVRSAARVFKIPLGEVNKTLKPVATYNQYLTSPLTKEFRDKYPEVKELCDKLMGHIEKTGVHAGGLVLSSEPISNYAPIQSGEEKYGSLKRRVPVVGLDMNEAANIGLIKMDFLGLKTLSVLGTAEKLIQERHDPNFTLESIPVEDAATFKMLSQGRTKMVFQCEAGPYTNTIQEMGGVANFDELVASNALVRPGASKSSFGGRFIAGKNGNYTFIHKDCEWFTQTTYGSILYQEQQMLLCTELCGMSMNEANQVRRAIGKKKLKDLEVWEPRFVEGATIKIGKQAAQALWKDLLAAAEYSFNLSHAEAYSLVSYWTAYLKRHYTIEFVSASLEHEDDKDAVMDYLAEAKRMGVRIKLPHVNFSELNFSIGSDEHGDHIRIGLSNIKFISELTGGRLIQQRPYGSYKELYETVNTKGSGLTSRTLQGLNAVGAAMFFDNPLKGDERDNYYEYLNIPAFDVPDLDPAVKRQMVPLEEFMSEGAFFCMGMARKVTSKAGWCRIDFVDETGECGAFVSPDNDIVTGKMYIFLIANNSIIRWVEVRDLIEGRAGGFGKFIVQTSFPEVAEGKCKVVSFKPRKTKAGKLMADIVVSDNNKVLTAALVFPDDRFMSILAKCKPGAVVSAQFKETKEGTPYLFAVK